MCGGAEEPQALGMLIYEQRCWDRDQAGWIQYGTIKYGSMQKDATAGQTDRGGEEEAGLGRGKLTGQSPINKPGVAEEHARFRLSQLRMIRSRAFFTIFRLIRVGIRRETRVPSSGCSALPAMLCLPGHVIYASAWSLRLRRPHNDWFCQGVKNYC